MQRAHLVQLDICWEDKSANYLRVKSLLAEVDVQPGDLIVLPEMFDTGFSFNIDRTADNAGVTRRFLASLAQSRNAYLYAGFTMVGADGKGRNRAHVYGPDGSVLCQYDKVHPFSFGREPEQFAPGAEVATCDWRAGEEAIVVCPTICYDLRFPELFGAGLSLGAELFIVGANWPVERAGHWKALLIARAIENQAFVLGVNRVGSDPHLSYSGGSIAIDPAGEILGEAADEQTVLTVEIDVQSLRDWRRTFPAWQERVEDLQQG
jgi:omega-amidase